MSLPEEEELPESESEELQVQTVQGEGRAGGREGELVVTKRTAAMHKFLGTKFDESDSTSLEFQPLFADKKKRTVAIAFFELLSITSKDCLSIHQEKPYAPISITKTVSSLSRSLFAID